MSEENKGREFIVNKPSTGFYGPDNWFELPTHRAWKVEPDNTVNGLTGEWYHFVEKKDLEKCQAENESLEQRLADAESLLNEMDKYLDYNLKTSIGSGSMFHKQIKSLLADGSKYD